MAVRGRFMGPDRHCPSWHQSCQPPLDLSSSAMRCLQYTTCFLQGFAQPGLRVHPLQPGHHGRGQLSLQGQGNSTPRTQRSTLRGRAQQTHIRLKHTQPQCKSHHTQPMYCLTQSQNTTSPHTASNHSSEYTSPHTATVHLLTTIQPQPIPRSLIHTFSQQTCSLLPLLSGALAVGGAPDHPKVGPRHLFSRK